MYSLTALLAFAALVAAQAPTIATPASLVQCQPAQISYVATSTPVFISIIPGGQPSATPLEDLGQQNTSPFTWTVNIASGTEVTLQIRDNTGAVAYSAPVTIQASSDSSCLGAGASSSGAASASQTGSAPVSSASASSASTSEVAASSSVAESSSSVVVSSSASSALSTATAPATTSRATSAAGSTSRTATATSAATSATTTPNSASSNMQVGFAGLLGLAAAAILA